MPTFECIFPATNERFAIERHESVLPPDNATLRMAMRAGRYVALMQIAGAHLFSEATERQDLKPEPARILDLGSGTGVMGIATTMKILENKGKVSEVIAIDNDPTAAANTEQNYAIHIKQLNASIKTTVHCNTWNDDNFWNNLGRIDTIICNPPYLALDEKPIIRNGYEKVNPEALYVPSTDDVFALYKNLISRSLDVSTPWAQHFFRLPRLTDQSKQWSSELAYQKEIVKKLAALKNDSQIVHFQSELFNPDLGNQSETTIGNDTLRHLQMLSLRFVPDVYPWYSGLNDAGVVHYINHGELLSHTTYGKYLRLSGYPQKRDGMVMSQLL